MAAKQVLFHDDARSRMVDGVNLLTKDGVSVAKEIELKDKFENMGAQMVKEVASKTSDLAGDGTTTATVLAQSIVREGMKYVAAGMNPMDLKRGIDKAVIALVEQLAKNSKPCSTHKEIAQVGSISANSDAEIGDIISSAMEKVGKEGVITVEDGKSQPSAADPVRRSRRRSAGYPGGQQHPRHSEDLRCQGSWLWRSSQGNAGRHGHPDRWYRDLGRDRHDPRSR